MYDSCYVEKSVWVFRWCKDEDIHSNTMYSNDVTKENEETEKAIWVEENFVNGTKEIEKYVTGNYGSY